MQFPQSGKEASSYGRRGAARALAGALYRIEGESVTAQQIADRLGVTKDAVRARLARLRRASGAITWARLGA